MCVFSYFPLLPCWFSDYGQLWFSLSMLMIHWYGFSKPAPILIISNQKHLYICPNIHLRSRQKKQIIIRFVVIKRPRGRPSKSLFPAWNSKESTPPGPRSRSLCLCCLRPGTFCPSLPSFSLSACYITLTRDRNQGFYSLLDDSHVVGPFDCPGLPLCLHNSSFGGDLRGHVLLSWWR